MPYSSVSKPEVSPNKEKAIFISPLEWEVPGSLYLMDLIIGEIKEIIPPDKENDEIPKYAIWINDRYVACIIGFGMGTVSIGGNVFLYDLENSTVKQITYYSSDIQITEIVKLEDTLDLKGIKYVDDIYNEFKPFEDTLDLTTIT
ncbi:hypothetical protein BEP19_04795 [Ammoniphilus oxalaticus]|uniref:Uncharacterized protein n=1 Tax=Ammoniphilus oxalaticus TaxID=66863 RepID=A0A419SMG5_9BACL|nr:hypothetical protein BEP19_04795 [Ammoniphilus oxalaticus]